MRMASSSLVPRRSLCFISARNLGDAVIFSRFLRRLVDQEFASKYIVWTFPQAKFLFADVPNCSVVTSDFPIGASMKSFFKGGFLGFLRAFVAVFRQRPEVVLELVSDYRERLLSTLLLSRNRLYIHWDWNHPFRHQIHSPKWRGRPFIDIPSQTPSIYAAYNAAFTALTGDRTPVFDAPTPIQAHSKRLALGIHPFASAPCKLWPMQRWSELISQLASKSCDLVLFGAPSDRAKLQELALSYPGRVEIFAESLPKFVDRMVKVDLLIGLDSFSIHLASDMGIQTIHLNGPNDPRVFSPIGSKVVSRPHVCPHQPCNGRPACIETDYQYVCMTSIDAPQVLEQVDSILTRGDLAP